MKPLEPDLFANMEDDYRRGIVHPETDPEVPLDVRFQKFHEANPHVYRVILNEALAVWRTGQRQWSINGVFEVLRWKRFFVSPKPEQYKLNNSFRAFYARMVMENVPTLKGFFELRRQRYGSND